MDPEKLKRVERQDTTTGQILSQEPSRATGSKGGPKTKAGKERVKYNALKHGLSAKKIVVPGLEKAEDYKAMFRRLRKAFRPKGPAEELLVETIMHNVWKRDRSVRAEATAFALAAEKARESAEAEPEFDDEAEEPRHRYFVLPSTRDLKRNARYAVPVNRALARALETLQELQKARLKAERRQQPKGEREEDT